MLRLRVLARTELGSAENQYAILGKLASGGMADLFLARTKSSAGVERYVVLKRVLSHRADDVTFVNMFLDEARLVSQLQHPNIAQVYDTGRLDSSYFFTMEYVHGETVRDVMRRAFEADVMVPIGGVLKLAAGAAAGLAHAHERISSDGKPLHIVHRDVSPSNLMISYEGNVKIVDFGVAKATLRSVETISGTVKGKMGYMAPEQCKGADVDLRADLFGLGIVLWEMLVGDRLYKRATDFETMQAIVSEPTPAPSTRRPDVPPAIDAIVLKLLQKLPGDRYQSARELLDDVEAAAASTGHAISASTLRRFLVDLFGAKPEPWLTDAIAARQDELLTVSGGIPMARADQGEVRLDRLLAQMGPLPAVRGTSKIPNTATPRRRRVMPIVIGLITLGAVAVIVLVMRREARDTEPNGHVASARLDATNASASLDAAISVDAAESATADAAIAMVIDAASPSATPDAIAHDALADAIHERRYAEAMAMCATDKKLARAEATACTLAACHENAVATARRWWKYVARNERASTIETCRAMGVALNPRSQGSGRGPGSGSAAEKCSDPMECRK